MAVLSYFVLTSLRQLFCFFRLFSVFFLISSPCTVFFFVVFNYLSYILLVFDYVSIFVRSFFHVLSIFFPSFFPPMFPIFLWAFFLYVRTSIPGLRGSYTFIVQLLFKSQKKTHASPGLRPTSMHFLWLKTEGNRIFHRQKVPPHRYSMCHLIVICDFDFFHGGIAAKSDHNSDLNSTIRGVIHAGLGDQQECGTSWGTG